MKQNSDTEAKKSDEIQFRTASSSSDFKDAEYLFHLYAASLGIDLKFQNFQKEIQTMQVRYNLPTGAIILAYSGNEVIACVGIRKFRDEVVELKRMFVKESFRHRKLGRKMLEKALETARKLGYKFVRLDTLPSMRSARFLYKDFGFYEIPPYRFNPIKGALFLEKKLD